MTITFPRNMPNARVQNPDFDLTRTELQSPDAAGRLESTRIGEDLWWMKINTECANELDFREWCSFCNSLDGAAKKFYGRDLASPLPYYYQRDGFTGLTRHGGGSFDGTVSDWDVAGSGDELILRTLPDGFHLTHGDYIGAIWETSKRALFQVQEDRTADGSGVGQWTVRPYPMAWLPGDAVLNLLRPTCLMKIKPGTWSRERAMASKRIQFEALQHIDV